MRSLKILIDTHYLAHRAFYAMPALEHLGNPTGVLYGVFRDITWMRLRFQSDQLIFCFDSPTSKRKQLYPPYKANRDIKTEEEKEAKGVLRRQIDELRDSVLRDMGFQNILIADGYEADDLIASVLRADKDKKQRFVIMSGDSDLYQLLDKKTTVYHPQKREIITPEVFRSTHGVHPDMWGLVKSLAGCKSDNVPGAKGIGDKFAARYWTGLLPPKSKRVNDIEAFLKTEQWKLNLQLVDLPFSGCPELELERQEDISEKAWREVIYRYGIKTLNNQHGFFG